MRKALALALLILSPAIGRTADPPSPWKLPLAEGHNWVARIKKVVARDGWSVELQGNDVIVRREKAVAMARTPPNSSPDAKPTPDGERAVRFTLRFAVKMTADEYDRLAEVNAASAREYERLHRAVGLPHKFDDFIATTAAEKERVRAFREVVSKLTHHDLPDLYSPDHSIYLLQPWDGWSSPSDGSVAAECRDVQDALLRYFGVYDPAAAAERRSVGRYLPESGR